MTFSLAGTGAEAGVLDAFQDLDLGGGRPARHTAAATAVALESLRARAAALIEPGYWWPEAWKVVGPALVTLQGWPGHSLRLEMAGGTELQEPDAWDRGPDSQTLTVRLDARSGAWCAEPSPTGTPSPNRSDGESGDSFFEAVLRALPPSAGFQGPMSCAAGLRRAVAAHLLQALDQWQRTPGKPAWLADAQAGLALQREPTAAVEPVGVTRAAMPPPGDASCVRPSRRGSLASSEASGRIARAARLIRRGAWREACDVLESLHPRSLVPYHHLYILCAQPFLQQDEALMDRLVLLIERLAAPPSDLFLPALGLSPDGTQLDFHCEAICPAFPPDHRNFWAYGEAMRTGMARVLFEVHLRRGAINQHTNFVVGRHGSNALCAAVAASMTAQGWVPKMARWSQTHRRVGGVLTVRLENAHGTSGRDYRGSWARRMVELNAYLEALDRCPDDERVMRQMILLLRTVDEIDRLRSVLDAFGACPGLPRQLYFELARGCARSCSWAMLDEVLAVIQQRIGGGLPAEEWVSLIIMAGDAKLGWSAGMHVYERRCREPGTPSDEELAALFSRANRAEDIDSAVALYDSLQAAGCPSGPEMLRVLVRRSAVGGQSRHVHRFRDALRRLGVVDDDHLRQSQLILDCRHQPLSTLTARLTVLRRQGGHLDRETLRAVLQAHVRAGRLAEAADQIRESVARGDNVYQPHLGCCEELYAQKKLNFSQGNLYQANPANAVRRWGSPHRSEMLALLHLHRQAGRMVAGTELFILQVHIGLAQDYLAGLDLGLVPVVSPTGVEEQTFRLVPLQSPDAAARGRPGGPT